MKQKIVKAIVTGFYVGCIPVIPGTFGSLLAFPFCLLLFSICNLFKFRINISTIPVYQQELLGILLFFLLVCAGIFVFGIYLINIYIQKVSREDPKEVVIDEVGGQMLTIILSCLCPLFIYASPVAQKLSQGQIDFIFLCVIPFIMFRIFDGIKPWPISWIDAKIKGGLGVMLDDYVAAIFASIMSYSITFLIAGVVS